MNNIGFKNDKIFLLSIEEYKRYKKEIPLIKNIWWLRDSGNTSFEYSAQVCTNGVVHEGGAYVANEYLCVRPALKYDSLEIENSKLANCFMWNETRWKIIDKENKIAIADFPICFDMYDDKSNIYETSFIRGYLLNWIK